MSPEISGVQGSVSQVREVTAELMQIAKTNNIATFIVGHDQGGTAGWTTGVGKYGGYGSFYFEGNVITPSVFYEQSKPFWFNQ